MERLRVLCVRQQQICCAHERLRANTVCVNMVELGLGVSSSESDPLQDKRDTRPVYTDLKEDLNNPDP